MAAVLVETLIEVYENNDTPLTFDLVQDDGTVFAVDPTSTVEFRIKDTGDETDAAATLIAGTVVNGPAGTISVEVPASACATPGTYRHRCDVVTTAGKRRTVMAGPFVVRNV